MTSRPVSMSLINLVYLALETTHTPLEKENNPHNPRVQPDGKEVLIVVAGPNGTTINLYLGFNRTTLIEYYGKAYLFLDELTIDSADLSVLEEAGWKKSEGSIYYPLHSYESLEALINDLHYKGLQVIEANITAHQRFREIILQHHSPPTR